MLAALPAPTPLVFVGVFTLTKMISASAIAASMFVEKNKFLNKYSEVRKYARANLILKSELTFREQIARVHQVLARRWVALNCSMQQSASPKDRRR